MGTRMSDQLGRVLGGRYRLVAPVGTGASAQVFVADDTTLGRRVAVKVLHPALSSDEAFLRRFRAEARAAAALSHPNLMAVYDWGEDGEPYLVLEYLAGGSLRAMLDRGEPLSLSQTLVVGVEAAKALAAAHANDFVHRDIKPANLLFGADGRLRIADFGLARALSEAAWTEPGDGLIGTARYAAPEQARGGRVDGKADVYALGLVLIESATGTVPLTRESTVETMMARVDNPVPVPDELGPLQPILTRMGLVDPADRPTAAEVERELLAVARQLPVPAPLPIEVHEPAPVVSDSGEVTVLVGPDATDFFPSTAAPPPAPRARRWPWLVLGLVVLAAVAGAGIVLWQQLQPPSAPVPDVVGEPLAEARGAIEAAMARADDDVQWRIEERPEYSEGVAIDHVIRQEPGPNGQLDDGGTITLVISRGPPPVDVPDVTHRPEAEARQLLEDAELGVGTVTPQPHEEVAAGLVLTWRHDGQDRPAEVPKGTGVELVVSSGPAPRTVPDLQGRSEAEARAELEGMGLVPVRGEDFHDTVPKDQVIRTEPAAGQQVERGAQVTYVISKGPDLVTVPDVIDLSRDEAERRLEAAGFTVSSNGPRRGRVFETDPNGGTKAKRGTLVTIYLR